MLKRTCRILARVLPCMYAIHMRHDYCRVRHPSCDAPTKIVHSSFPGYTGEACGVEVATVANTKECDGYQRLQRVAAHHSKGVKNAGQIQELT